MSKNLEEALKSTGNIVERQRNSQIGIYVYPVVAAEFANWRSEQVAWRQSAVLYDQSHHMGELMVEGPDAEKLLSRLGINSFANFTVGKAKHFVPCTEEGYVVGDVILFRLEENRYNLVGRTPSVNWVQFHAETGSEDVQAARDDRSPSNPAGKAVKRRHYRFQIQGPNAPQILEQLNGGPVPDIKFFNFDWINIAGRKVRALRHGMAGVPGLEVWGPYEEIDEIRGAIVEAGKDHGLVQVGNRAYSTNTAESGWIPSPLPAIYTGQANKAYREWLPAAGYEGTASIGGSFVSDDIEDYYSTPFELGYGFYVKFDHDFIGRKAIEDMENRPHRKKVTFEWNPDDVTRVVRSSLEPGGKNFKWIDFPQPNYASSSFDMVTKAGKTVGLSMFMGYSFNERALLSLGVVDPDIEIGDQLTLVWGEENGGTTKPSVEPHEQTEIRVKVAPTPYSRDAREGYAVGSWRSKS